MFKTLGSIMGKGTDLVLVFMVVSILLILFTPIPSELLDLLILTNFAFALTILLLTFYVPRPVDFSTFPSLLLVATLFRLSLNVAATRLILSGAEAGQVIAAVGAFVVQGNFVIGLIVFLILIIVQYVVVTNGAQRVSEVAARFVLDAMPGQQMSIDADLNMGLIDQEEAKARRKGLEKEASFYGAMDGASKFVKGDAIAGIIILLVNIVGGLIIGATQMGMRWDESLRTFTLLTIGDGIVTQVPALVIAVATGIIVTRSASDRELSSEIMKQLVQFPRVQMIVLIALTGLMLLPGMPMWPFSILVAVVLVVYFVGRRRLPALQKALEAEQSKAEQASEPEVKPLLPIEVTLGQTLIGTWGNVEATLSERVAVFRKQFTEDFGMVVPSVVFRDAPKLAPTDYEILISGARMGRGSIVPDQTLAIHTATHMPPLRGTATKDPAFGLPGVWIADAEREAARQAGYTLVDPLTVLITHLTETLRINAAQLLTRAETVRLLDGVRTRQPGLVEELVPTVLAVSDVQRILQNLLTEHVSVRNLDLIIEVLADAGRTQKDPQLLTELVRQRLGLPICQNLRGTQDALAVLTMDPALESTIAHSVQASDGATAFVLEPRLAEQFLKKLLTSAENMMRNNLTPVLLCSPEIRRHIKSFTRRAVPRLAVLAISEVPTSIDLKSFGVVSIPVDKPGVA